MRWRKEGGREEGNAAKGRKEGRREESKEREEEAKEMNFSQGCLPVLREEIRQHSVVLGATALSVSLVQLCGIVISCLLFSRLKNYHDEQRSRRTRRVSDTYWFFFAFAFWYTLWYDSFIQFRRKLQCFVVIWRIFPPPVVYPYYFVA